MLFLTYDADKLYEIAGQRIKQAHGNLVIRKEALPTLCEFVANEYRGISSSYF
jgi:Cdc6-like AAA superfamily ATPase